MLHLVEQQPIDRPASGLGGRFVGAACEFGLQPLEKASFTAKKRSRALAKIRRRMASEAGEAGPTMA